MTERKIPRDAVQSVLDQPDSLKPSTIKPNRKVYQKLTGQKLMRVVAEDNRLITVYVTDKLDKYLGREDA